ncbi:MAG: sugar phosphate isomerase/epimerase family protein [Armatimonadota bacterium]|nr:sugar phosphate isomerase/epimerase family protein [Armatimonadota bacterium]
MAVQFGCFTRPWSNYSWEEFLEGTAAANYGLVGTMRMGSEWIIGPDTPEGVAKERREEVEDAGLAPSTCLISFPLDQGQDAAEQGLRDFIDSAAAFGARYLLSCGTARGPNEDLYYDTMAACCDYAQEKGVMLALKPHGGITCTGADLLHAVDRIDHENFGIYYDPGNIMHYKGLDPVTELRVCAEHVVAMCIKDSLGELEGVSILPGTGVVDFEGVFEVLFDAGFDGHCVVECLGGETLEEVNANAAETHNYLVELAL